MNKFFRYILFCALPLVFSLTVNAQTRSLPQSFHDWLKSPGIKHATVALEVARLTQPKGPKSVPSKDYVPLYQYDPQRLMIPGSVMKLVTTATAVRLLGGDYVFPDTAAIIDTIMPALPGLEYYNKDWLIEDIGEDYIDPMTDSIPDRGLLLRDVIHETNVKSINNKAETILRLLDPGCHLDSAILIVSDYWKSRGLDPESLIMYDGCGLAPSDRVTPRFMTQMLADMRNDEDFFNSMAVVGKEGTVRRFLLKSRLEGKGRLKTGTIKTAVAYAGYMTGSDGNLYAVSIFVNNFTCKTQVVRKGVEKVLLSLIP